MLEPVLSSALLAIPPGRYAVGVSGGADSVALLHLLHHHRPDLHLHVIHLDHQTRGPASTGDAQFVRDLATRWSLPHTIARRDEIEAAVADPPVNPSALYRALRIELYLQVIQAESLDAVLLAHHAGDQAETILHRLLRGSGTAGLAGIAPESHVRGVRILHPLLNVPPALLRQYLTDAAQPWREDASNQSPDYFRNRLRQLLARYPDLAATLCSAHEPLLNLRNWVRAAAPELPESFPVAALRDLPEILAAEAARRWLVDRGVPPGEIAPPIVHRLLTMAADAASPARQHFPGRVLVRRRQGRIAVDPAP